MEKADVLTHELQYLYKDAHHFHFMNNATYEMLMMDEDALGDAAQWLVPNMVLQVEFYGAQPIGVELPTTLDLTVEETEPSMTGATKTAMTKPAKLENGVTVQVPAFIGVGEVVRVDPREGKYLERAK